MSLVPYKDSQDVILRHGSAVVLYDPHSRQISLGQDSSEASARADGAALAREACPTCHRPYHEEYDRDASETDEERDATFADPEYFRILHRSLPPSRNPSQSVTPRQLSPRRRLIAARTTEGAKQTVGIDHGRNSGIDTHAGAEFVSSSPVPPETANPISATAFAPDYFHRFFIIERELGRGGKGVVLLVKHIIDDVSLGYYACKRVPVGNDHEWLKKVLVEVQLLTSLIHPNLVQYKYVWLEEYKISTFGPSVPCAFILQQYCNAGDLHGYMLDSAKAQITTQQLKEQMRRRSKGQMDPVDDLHGPRRMHFEQIFSFFKDITAGLNHLHSNGYIHRDLKPSNCLLHRSSNGQLRVLVSDFGEVQVVSAARSGTGSTGTISYCAPEILRRDSNGAFGNFSTKSDIFSLGMIVFFMCFGRLPYRNSDQLEEENEDVEELRAEITTWAGFHGDERQRADLPERLYKFLRRVLSLDPDDRPSTEHILQSIGAGSDFSDLTSTGLGSQIFEDTEPRVSSLDTPSGTPQRAHSHARTGPTPRNLSYNSNGAVPSFRRPGGSKLRPSSPIKAQGSPSRPSGDSWSDHKAYVEGTDNESEADDDYHDDLSSGNVLESSVILRTRSRDSHKGSPRASAPSSPSRRLLLPAPYSQTPLLTRISNHPLILGFFNRGLLKLSLFIFKMFSLIQPCAPLLPKVWVLYPVLAVAMLDFVFTNVSLTHDEEEEEEAQSPFRAMRLSALLLLLHFGLLGVLRGSVGLCPGKLQTEMPW